MSNKTGGVPKKLRRQSVITRLQAQLVDNKKEPSQGKLWSLHLETLIELIARLRL